VGIPPLDFAEFHRRSADECLRAVLVSVGDLDTAQDLVDEAFARAWASWRTVSRHPAPTAWVVRTALNTNISRWRRRRREVSVPDPGTVADPPMAGGAADSPTDPRSPRCSARKSNTSAAVTCTGSFPVTVKNRLQVKRRPPAKSSAGTGPPRSPATGPPAGRPADNAHGQTRRRCAQDTGSCSPQQPPSQPRPNAGATRITRVLSEPLLAVSWHVGA
jgi:hypothetical protein